MDGVYGKFGNGIDGDCEKMKEKSMKKALFISCFDWYHNRLKPIKELLSSEYKITILLADYNHIQKKEYDYKEPGCTYISIPKYKKNLSLKRIYSHWYFGNQVRRYLQKSKPDLVYALVPPNNIAKRCFEYIQNNTGCKCYFDIIDLWPESMPIGRFKESFLARKWAKLRNKYIGCAEHIFLECEFYLPFIQEYAKNKNIISVLPLYKEYSLDQYERVMIKIREYKKVEDVIVLGYVGSMNNILDIVGISNICLWLIQNGKKVELHIIGDGERRKSFINTIKNIGVKVYYYGITFDEKKKIDILSKCDYALNMMKDTVTVGLTIKSIDYLSMGLPLINNIKGDTWNMVSNTGFGINYNGDQEAFIRQIENYHVNRNEIIHYFLDNFTVEAFKKNVKHFLLQNRSH